MKIEIKINFTVDGHKVQSFRVASNIVDFDILSESICRKLAQAIDMSISANLEEELSKIEKIRDRPLKYKADLNRKNLKDDSRDMSLKDEIIDRDALGFRLKFYIEDLITVDLEKDGEQIKTLTLTNFEIY